LNLLGFEAQRYAGRAGSAILDYPSALGFKNPLAIGGFVEDLT